MEVIIYDRNYFNWLFKPINVLETASAITAYIHPLMSKLFHGDILSITGTLIHSPYQRRDNIPGVLVLDGKTYGRANNDAKNSKLLYKCIPHDPALPCFLLPYEEKVVTFNKKKINKYITFRFTDWPDKHPLGQITETIGEVNKPEHYYQYQVASKYLQKSISTFTKETMAAINMKPRENMAEHIAMKQQLVDRRNEVIFSIDPAGCKDIDDAIGIQVINKYHSIISVYIANVPLLLDYLNLWHAFSERVATIYLPTSKIPMLPPILSDDICSLVQGKDRCAFSLDIYIEQRGEDQHTIQVSKIEFNPVIINVKKNYVYEEETLLKNKTYIKILHLTKLLAKQYTYVDQLTDSHELVEFYMIFMNYESAKRLLARKSGIFRSATLDKEPVPVHSGLSKDMRSFLKTYQISQCHYCTYEQVKPHDLIGLSSYAHITSPIRRLVDLLNMCEMQEDRISGEAKHFMSNWFNRLDYINMTMKSIRKVQNNCNLLATYLKDTSDGRYTGLLFEKKMLLKDAYKFSVYIPALKMVSTVKTTHNFDNYRVVIVSAHSFMDEDNVMKKIRIQIA